uniref:NADH dehydrogenase subunit 6 n=1 Tax=Taenia tianguangfui TaxID=1548223 RepID=A0A8K1QXP2_9CEST|nr:NADH dehydrogenase subunit 6 [Taenia tianguangfui]
MLLELSISLYFFILILFSLSSHCVYYCILLVLNALVSGFICYLLYGYSWYSLIFCLVYIGGVYILFIFMSIFNPNDNFVSYYNLSIFSMIFMFIIGLLCAFVFYSLINIEFSMSLCTVSEGSFYLCLCLTLVFGFLVLSLIGGFKMNFYR